MQGKKTIVDLVRARQEVVSHSPLLGTQTVGVINAHNRILAEDVAVTHDVPEHHLALSDGYAVMSADTLGAHRRNPRQLGVSGEAFSGSLRKLEPGTAARVKRGWALPQDSDAVLTSSETFRPEDGPLLLVFEEVKPWHNAKPAGAILTAGSVISPSGTTIGHHEMGVLASLGIHGVKVSIQPHMSILTVGEGLVDILDDMKPGQMRNSGRYVLTGMATEAGCEVADLRHVTTGRLGLERALAECRPLDIAVVVMGPDEKHDVAVAALGNVGEVVFERVQMEPGAATAFGTVNGRPVFVVGFDSLLESFEAVVRPAVMSMQRAGRIDRTMVQAELRVTIKPNQTSHSLFRAVTWFDGERCAVRAFDRVSPDNGVTAKPNSLIVIPPQTDLKKRGETVDVWLLQL